MREIGVPFKGPLALANLSGRKTQTRRLVSSPKWSVLGFTGRVDKCIWAGLRWDLAHPELLDDVHRTPSFNVPDENGDQHFVLPRYRVGDRIWQRVRWGAGTHLDHIKPIEIPAGERIHYLADHPNSAHATLATSVRRWRPSIHMPRCASRGLFEIIDVRGVFPRDISREDAIAEGCPDHRWHMVEGGPEKWFKSLLCDIHAGSDGVLDLPFWAFTYRRIDA